MDGDPTLTAALILWADPEVFPPALSPQCVSFIQAALTKDPAARPAAAQLLLHPWIVGHLNGTIGGAAQQQAQAAAGSGRWLRCVWDGLASLLPFLRGNQVQPEQQLEQQLELEQQQLEQQQQPLLQARRRTQEEGRGTRSMEGTVVEVQVLAPLSPRRASQEASLARASAALPLAKSASTAPLLPKSSSTLPLGSPRARRASVTGLAGGKSMRASITAINQPLPDEPEQEAAQRGFKLVNGAPKKVIWPSLL